MNVRAVRTRWVTSPALALTLGVTMLGQQPAVAAPPAWNPPAAPEVHGVPVRSVRPLAARAPVARPQPAARASWPAAGQAAVDILGAGGLVAATGGLPVRVGARTAPDDTALPPSRLTVAVYDRAASERAGIRGVLLSLVRADGGTADARLTVEVNYSGFVDAYGGDWAARLRLVRLPSCVLTTPELAECRTASPLAGRNDVPAATLTAQASAGVRSTVLAAVAGANGDSGDYAATSLSSAGTWKVSNQTGDFSWSYGLRMPPSPGGPAPTVSLGYSSGSVDGRTGASNNQGGWIGDGWDVWPGFIERKYASCSSDNPGHPTGDQCWSTDNATLSLNGHAGELIQDGAVWRLRNDDGTRIERVVDAARGNGDNDNEYWKVTTTDGTQYFFGYHRLPGWVTGNPVTDSVWTVPVYGNNSGEPCYNATFANAWCNQAWRWNLDYVVDPHDNTMAYSYGKETGWYGRDNTDSQRTAYVRGGWLDRIEYGTRRGMEYNQAAPLRVTFGTAERCLSACWSGSPWASKPTPVNWKDTPWDLDCAAAPCTQSAPTFWSTRRLATVTTQIRNGESSYIAVESWTLRHEFPNAGFNEGSPMWLRGITRTGLVGDVPVSDPEITFGEGAEPLPNRVDGPSDGRSALNRWRLKTINNESGGQVVVSYAPTGCTRGALPSPDTNTTRCMPAYYAPPATGTATLDWFHKYVVARVDLDDLVTDQPTETFFYDYLDSPAWHYTNDEITKAEFRTWGDWRGYGRVQVRHGQPGGAQTAAEYRYLRGMNGDRLSSGTRSVVVADNWGGSIVDHEALNGFVLQEITLNGVGGAEVRSSRNEPWMLGPTATRTRNGVTSNAWKTTTAGTRIRTALAAGGYRTAMSSSEFNADGFVVRHDEFGDEAVDGDETCTRTSYARNDMTWMIDKVARVETLSGSCAAAPGPEDPARVLRATRTFYDTYVDDSSLGRAPTAGDAVRSEELDHWNGVTPVYVAVASNRYDASGRILDSVDARGNKTETRYTTANGGLLTGTVVTNPLGHQVTTTSEPAWNLPTRLTDANGVSTDLAYDGLGRLTKVWLPGRSRATQSPSMTFGYLVRASGGPSAVTTLTLLPSGSAYRKSVSLFDGFLRERQSQTQAPGGGRVLTDTFRDPAGNTAWASGAYYDSSNAAPDTGLGVPQGEIPAVTHYVYDGAGRATAAIFKASGAEKWRTTTSYGGDRVHTVPPAGGTAKTTISDVNGRTVALRQYHDRADVGSSDPGRYDETKYGYDLAGSLVKVIDPAGNTWRYAFDLRGRQTLTVDPDRGSTTSAYDPAGNLVSITDALDNVLASTYDALGRRTSVRDGSPSGPKRSEWVYDTLPGGLGKLTKSIRYVGTDAYENRVDAYDAYGRPTATSVVLPASEGALCAAAAPDPCTYTTAVTYKADGSIASTTVPAAADLPGERLTLGYNDVGQQTTVISPAQIYVYAVTYNKLGRLTQRQLGAFGARIAVTSSFDEPTGRLTGMSVLPERKTEAASYGYSYNNAGNVTGITDAPAGQPADHQCYRYDQLSRLVDAWTPGAGDCGATPSTVGLGGAAPYWHSWTYDVTGNRTQETRHATAGDTTFTYVMPPSGPDSVRPHAVASVTAAGPGLSWTRGYSYDDAGNTTTRPADSGAPQTLRWNAEGRLDSITDAEKTTGYVCDADGNRLIRTDSSGAKVLYLSGGTEVSALAGRSTATATRYYAHGGTVIAVRTSTSLYWIVGDHHGTAELIFDAHGLTASRRRSLPFGEDRGTAPGDWPAAMDKGFLGGTRDPSGLTHLGAREYDPFLGRFTSVDPLISHDDPQLMNGYAYSNNNPATYTDPDGRCLRLDDRNAPCVNSKNYKERQAAFELRSNSTGSNPGKPSGVSARRDPNAWGANPLNDLNSDFPGASVCALNAFDCDTWMTYGDLEYIAYIAYQAGIDPRMLFAILQHEGAGRNGWDPVSQVMELTQVVTGYGTPSIGLGQMQETVFADTVANHRADFGDNVAWTDLMHDRRLAMKATAYLLRDLQDDLDSRLNGSAGAKGLNRHELVAYGYNSGAGPMVDTASWGKDLFDSGPRYAASFRSNWQTANTIFCSGKVGFTCG